MMSACIAKLAATPPVVASHSTATYSSPASECLRTAPDTFAICIRLRMPSCTRAPPETVKPTTGSLSLSARSNRRVSFSPTAAPIDPIMKPGSIAKKAQGTPSMLPFPVRTASFSPLAAFACSSFCA